MKHHVCVICGRTWVSSDRRMAALFYCQGTHLMDGLMILMAQALSVSEGALRRIRETFATDPNILDEIDARYH